MRMFAPSRRQIHSNTIVCRAGKFAARTSRETIQRLYHGEKGIRPIRSETDYDTALEEIERYFENEPKLGTPEADRFDLLALIIEDYERKRWPIVPPVYSNFREVNSKPSMGSKLIK